MLTRPTELRVFLHRLNVLINNGAPGRAEALISGLLKREPALRAKVDVLNALKQGIELEFANADGAATVLDFIAKKIREFQPS